MDSVVFDGKEYVKASVLAKKFRYTADYLGQLCRGKKVDARLVGRAWYINLDSLNQHRDGRYKSTTIKVADKDVTESVNITKKPSNNYLSRIDVEPVLKNKTVKIFKSKNGTLSEFSVKYEGDDYSLIPRVNKSAVFANIPIIPAEAERLRVPTDNQSQSISFKAESLPEVFLKGMISVTGLPEVLEEIADTEEETETTKKDVINISNKIKPELNVVRSSPKLVSVRRVSKTRSRLSADIVAPKPVPAPTPEPVTVQVAKIAPLPALHQQPAPIQRPALLQPEVKNAKLSSVSAPKVGRVNFAPVSVLKIEPLKPIMIENHTSIALVLSVFILALGLSTLMAATNLEILTEGNLYSDRLVVQVANLSTFIDLLER